ncbi:hypothetical protein EVAR_30069_1 [Eumeta japonica]|uniref:Uncharacterized protein n=1 Tax=Eumeta variegata TaxID=151549 RepID=A0A4C1X9S7_EUMVA|nr:hypothetical protein EVAR_30069_1 [Eumeta japonica]
MNIEEKIKKDIKLIYIRLELIYFPSKSVSNFSLILDIACKGDPRVTVASLTGDDVIQTNLALKLNSARNQCRFSMSIEKVKNSLLPPQAQYRTISRHHFVLSSYLTDSKQ